jgi:tRNA-splicing ligase RtcB (3'-phosphate/5'-hydroxy nucleic acid ligase)
MLTKSLRLFSQVKLCSPANLPHVIKNGNTRINIFTDSIEQQALDQLKAIASSGIAEGQICAMPDVHMGKGAAVGSVFASSKYICPNAVGSDIGCGMSSVPVGGLTRENLTQE